MNASHLGTCRGLLSARPTSPCLGGGPESVGGGGSELYASECFGSSLVPQAESACPGDPKLCGEYAEDELLTSTDPGRWETRTRRIS